MKKLLVFLAILFVSVMSSACINNLAIQELNEKAKALADQGHYEEAAKRLESGIDLDGSVFETRYNLADVYVGMKKYGEAVNQINEAIKINPQDADAYYLLAVALEGKGMEIFEGDSEAETAENPDEANEQEAKEVEISPQKAQEGVNLLNDAVLNYQKYLETAKDVKDAENIKQHSVEIQNSIKEYTEKYLTPDADGDKVEG